MIRFEIKYNNFRVLNWNALLSMPRQYNENMNFNLFMHTELIKH
jgi:hypothetical protein